MRNKGILILFVCLILASAGWAQVAGPVQLVPAVARLNGNNGSYWQTDISVSNVSSEACIVEAVFLQADQANDGDHAPSHSVSLAAGQTLKVEDVLGTWFPQVGMTKGAMVFFAEDGNGENLTDGALAVSSRTYDAANPSKTYGQGVPAIALMGDLGLSTSTVFGLGRAVLTGVQQDERFRTNIGVFNLSMLEIKLHVRVYGADGQLAGEKEKSVPPLSLGQWGLPALGVSSLPNGGRVDITLDSSDIPADPCVEVPEVLSETEGEFIAYSTTMDGETNDSEFHLALADWSAHVSQCGQMPRICLGGAVQTLK